MTPYVIFVIVLTIAYIIYYGYNISKDLYGKKDQPETVVEEFDVSEMEGTVVATPVRESEEGFSVGEDSGQQKAEATPPTDRDSDKTDNRAKDKFDNIIRQLDETDVSCEGGMQYPELEQLMLSRKSDLVFRQSTIKQHREIL